MSEQCENANKLVLCELIVIWRSREYLYCAHLWYHIKLFFFGFLLLSDGVKKSVVMWNIPAVFKILLPGCRQSFLTESLLPGALWNAAKNICFS